MAGAEGVTLEVAGVPLDIRIEGEGPPLLFLHGPTGRTGSKAFRSELAKRWQVHAPSHPGWDATPPHPTLSNVQDLAELYAELREELGGATPVVGCSFGAWIAAQMASSVDRSIPSLVLVSPIGIKVGGREDRDYLDLFAASHDQVLSAYYSDPQAYPDYDHWVAGDFVNMARAQEAVARYAWCPYLHDPRLLRRLRRVTASTLVVHGAKDGVVLNKEVFTRFVDEIPSANSAELGELAHLIEEECPQELSALVLQHLDARSALASVRG